MKAKTAPEIQASDSIEIYLKQKFLEMIKSGKKTLELRVDFPVFRDISIGDRITFKSSSDEVTVKVNDIRRYESLWKVMESEDISKLIPDVPQKQIRHLAEKIFNESDIEKYGLLIFEFEKTG